MQELVPYQEKRKKSFSSTTTPFEAVTKELTHYFSKKYPELQETDSLPIIHAEAKVFGKQEIFTFPSLQFFAEQIALVTSPALLQDKELPWTLARLEAPLLLLRAAAISLNDCTKRPYTVLPKSYQKMIKKVYSDTQTVKKLAEFLSSAKKASRYMRIMQKRLGIYTKKRPPFSSKA